MNTTIYLVRHSEPFKVHKGNVRTNETILLENEKSPLSINGEKMAERFANMEEFKNLDLIYSSNYVRAMSTAKYFASVNDLKVNIDDRFNERIHGVDSWSELPNNFEINQFEDENYKVGFDESQKEVQSRMYEALCEIIKKNQGKRIAIVSHSTGRQKTAEELEFERTQLLASIREKAMKKEISLAEASKLSQDVNVAYGVNTEVVQENTQGGMKR